jgi:hypothetical protein
MDKQDYRFIKKYFPGIGIKMRRIKECRFLKG